MELSKSEKSDFLQLHLSLWLLQEQKDVNLEDGEWWCSRLRPQLFSFVLVILGPYAAIVILVELAWVPAQTHSWKRKNAKLKVKVVSETNKFKKYKEKDSNSSGLECGVQETVYAKVLLLGPLSMIANFWPLWALRCQFLASLLSLATIIWCFRWNRTSWKPSKKIKPRRQEFVHVPVCFWLTEFGSTSSGILNTAFVHSSISAALLDDVLDQRALVRSCF